MKLDMKQFSGMDPAEARRLAKKLIGEERHEIQLVGLDAELEVLNELVPETAYILNERSEHIFVYGKTKRRKSTKRIQGTYEGDNEEPQTISQLLTFVLKFCMAETQDAPGTSLWYKKQIRETIRQFVRHDETVFRRLRGDRNQSVIADLTNTRQSSVSGLERGQVKGVKTPAIIRLLQHYSMEEQRNK